MLTQNRLKELLEYSPETGGFFWRVYRAANADVGMPAGSINGDGYIHIKVDNKKYCAHRLAWLYMTGEWPTQEIDHINQNRVDNSWVNLRDVSKSINRHNTNKTTSSVGRKNIYWQRNRFLVKIRKEKKTIFERAFKTLQEAESALSEVLNMEKV